MLKPRHDTTCTSTTSSSTSRIKSGCEIRTLYEGHRISRQIRRTDICEGSLGVEYRSEMLRVGVLYNMKDLALVKVVKILNLFLLEL